MALLPIITAPDPRLKIRAQPVAAVDAKIRRLMDDMLETMYRAIGIGLAGPQVGAASRVIVVDVARDGEKPLGVQLADLVLVIEVAQADFGRAGHVGVMLGQRQAPLVRHRQLG